jgi:hypothetical protein
LNTSKIGSNTIKFTPVTSTSTSNDPSGILGGIFDGLLDGLSGITDDLTSAIDSDITTIEADLVTNITDTLGIHDVYNIYLHNICELDYQDSTDASSGTTTNNCPSFSDVADGKLTPLTCRNIAKTRLTPLSISISFPLRHSLVLTGPHLSGLGNFSTDVPSYVVVGTTNITVPLLAAAGDTFGYLQTIVSAGTKVTLVFHIIGLIASGIVMILSVVAVFVPRARRMVLVIRIFALLAPLMLLTSAAVITGLALVITKTVNGLGSALTISASAGTPAMVVGWVSWGLSSISSVYWLALWFVSFRRSSITRRIRTEDEIGNWGGIIAEVKRDLSLKIVKNEVRNVDVEKGAFKTAESGKTRPEKVHVASGGSDGESSGLLA